MDEQNIPSPDMVPAENDPGDETARRYRYQATFAASLCCALLDDTNSIVKVYCEQHEDILLQFSDGSFVGLQVKTRASGRPVWKTGDEDIISSCARFVKLDTKFPTYFRGFRFLTNHLLYVKNNGQDLRYVLKEINAASSVNEVPHISIQFLKKVAKEAEASLQVTFNTLSKTSASDDLPKLKDAERDLQNTLVSLWGPAAECSTEKVWEAAQFLSTACWRASSLASFDEAPMYSAALCTQDEELALSIEGKCIDLPRLLEILNTGITFTALLVGPPESIVKLGTGSAELLRKKLSAGGFSAVSVTSANDLRDKSDYLGLMWLNKYGDTKGLARYDHIRSLVLNLAAKSFEASKNEDRVFGSRMLDELCQRFEQKRIKNTELYDCSDEHLEGFAYALTSECKVQWSSNRPWEDE